MFTMSMRKAAREYWSIKPVAGTDRKIVAMDVLADAASAQGTGRSGSQRTFTKCARAKINAASISRPLRGSYTTT
jgi:hypothetical protein